MPYEILESSQAAVGIGSPPSRALPSGRHMIFRLAGELYAVDILSIREIIGQMETIRVPRTPEFLEGVINLRGRVVPVIDLRRRLGVEQASEVERPCIMILTPNHRTSQLTVGVVVDTVLAVHDIGADDVEPPPPLGILESATYLLAMARVEEKVVMVLDVDRLLSASESESLDALASVRP